MGAKAEQKKIPAGKGESEEKETEAGGEIPKETPAPPAGDSDPETTAAMIRDLERANKELQVRIKEIELEQAGATAESGKKPRGEAPRMSDDTNQIIGILNGLRGELDSAYELKQALQSDLEAARLNLSAEQSARTKLEARINLLEAKASLVEQLREDMAFVEQERDETARRLEEASSELKTVLADRESLLQQKTVMETHIKQLQGHKTDLEARVLNLKDKAAELERLRKEQAKELERNKHLEQSLREKQGQLETAETARKTTETELAAARENIFGQKERLEELDHKLTTARAELDGLQALSLKYTAENAKLRQSLQSAEKEIKAASQRNESLKKEAEEAKNALYTIRAASADLLQTVKRF
jgi:chromosome segregation ATPase